MDVIRFQPYRRLSDHELIMETFHYMSVVNHYNEYDEIYYNKVSILDNLVKECKKRKITLSDKRLAQKILTD